MEKNVLLLLIDHRRTVASQVQKVLTEYGCHIKTRLGLHDAVLDQCSDTGLIFLELVGDRGTHDKLTKEMGALDGVDARLVNLQVK